MEFIILDIKIYFKVIMKIEYGISIEIDKFF